MRKRDKGGDGKGGKAEKRAAALLAEDQERNGRVLAQAEERVAAMGDDILSGDATDMQCLLYVLVVRGTASVRGVDQLGALIMQRLPDPDARQVAHLLTPGGRG